MLIILKKTALPWLVLVATLLILGEARGQTPVPTYLNGQKTGNHFNTMLLGVGSAGLSSPMLSHTSGIFNTFRFYYGDNTILTGTTTNFTTIRAAQDIAVLGAVGAGADAYVQFRNNSNAIITGGKTTYFRIDKPVLSGISVAVGGLLGLTELQSVQGTGYSGAANYSISGSGSQNEGSSVTSSTKLLIDKNAKWYAAVTPTSDYNSVRLAVSFPSDLRVASVFANIETNVYNAFTQTDGGVCSLSPQFTSPGEASGITLTPAAITAGLGLNLSDLVKDPQLAINGNANDYSSFSTGIASVGVASTVAQNFHFDHTATAQDGVRVQIGIPQALVDLDVLGRDAIRFKAYSGTTQVFNEKLTSLRSLLQLNLLNIVTINGTSYKKLDLTLKPGVTFDRFEIVFGEGLAAVGVIGSSLLVFEVSMAPSLPTITLQPTNPSPSGICEGGATSFTVGATASAGGVISGYQWEYYNTVTGTWDNNTDGTLSTLSLTNVTNAMNNRWFRAKITGGNAGCPYDIYSNEVQLIVKPKALATDIDAPGTTICQGHSATLTASCNLVTIPNPIFKWYANADLTGYLGTGSTYDVITPTTTTTYWVTVEGTATCQNAPNSAKQVTVTVTPNPAAPAIIIN